MQPRFANTSRIIPFSPTGQNLRGEIRRSDIPDDFEIGAAFAIGYIDETATKPGVRTRKGLEEIVFAGDWDVPVPL